MMVRITSKIRVYNRWKQMSGRSVVWVALQRPLHLQMRNCWELVGRDVDTRHLRITWIFKIQWIVFKFSGSWYAGTLHSVVNIVPPHPPHPPREKVINYTFVLHHFCHTWENKFIKSSMCFRIETFCQNILAHLIHLLLFPDPVITLPLLPAPNHCHSLLCWVP